MKFLGEPKLAGLYGQHMWRSKGKMVVITEGEIDAASVSQLQDHKWPVVSIANGAGGAKKSISKSIDWLNNFETVVLMFDMDDVGQAAAKECAQLFKPGQCKIASLPLKDANECLVAGKGKEVIDAIWSAKVYRPDGIVMGNELFDLLTEDKEAFSLQFPWKKLNELTHGFRLGEVITLTAGTGVGKSAIIKEIAYHLCVRQGEPIGMLMFEEPIKRTALGLIGIHMKKPLHLLSKPHTEKNFKKAFSEVMGSGTLSLYDHFGSTEIDNVLDRIRYMARSLGARWIFVDHLSILVSGMAEGDERRLIDNAMTAIKSLAMELNVGIFLVSHLKRPEGKGHEEGARTALGQLRGSHAIAQLSDTVIGLERNQQDDRKRDITHLRVLKCRWTGMTGLAGWLKYDHETGTISELEDDPEDDFGIQQTDTHNPF